MSKSILLSVSPNGENGMTLSDAFKKADRLFSEATSPLSIKIALAEGLYNQSQIQTLDAGNYPYPAHLSLYAKEGDAVFSSLRKLKSVDFTEHPDKNYVTYQLEKQADGSYPNLRAFYVNGKIVPISTTGEYKIAPPLAVDGEEYAPRQEKFNETHKLYVPYAALSEACMEALPGAEIHIRVEWEFKIYHIERADLEDRVIGPDGVDYRALYIRTEEMNGGNPTLTMCQRVFFICGTPAVLKKEGLYCYDRRTGTIYYTPSSPLSETEFAIGIADGLFSFTGLTSLSLHGLTFTGIEDAIVLGPGYYAPGQAGRWIGTFPDGFPHSGAVRVRGAGRVDITECVFHDLPCDGISMVGGQIGLENVTIANCEFKSIGASAIRIGVPYTNYVPTNCVKNLTITRNYIDNIGFTYENSCSVLATKVDGAKLTHNTILHSSYSAVSLGWKWDVADYAYGEQINLKNVEVAYNYICSFVMNMRDGGGVYTLGGNAGVDYTEFMNSLHHNVVIEDELTCPENGFFGSLYHDGASSHWHTYKNVVVHNPALCGTTGSFSARIYLQKCSGPVHTGSTEGQAAWHILCEDNYIACAKDFGEVYRSQRYDPVYASDMLDASRDLREKGTILFETEADLRAYPDALAIINGAGASAK